MADYSNTSQYADTGETGDNLDILNPRTLTAEQDDQSYTIERTYAYRPDLLAYDLYGSPRLWWFSCNVIQTSWKIPYTISNRA